VRPYAPANGEAEPVGWQASWLPRRSSTTVVARSRCTSRRIRRRRWYSLATSS
jgi:hypothetical protein